MEIKNRFSFFRNNNYVYLDSSATTQVPDTVINGLKQTLEYRGNPNRSSHNPAKRNLELLENAKETISGFINAKPDEIVFGNNTTDVINLAIDSISHNFKKADVILISISEHHSNILPYLKTSPKGVNIKLLGLKDGLIDIEEIKKHLTRKTKLVAVTHCSNVLGNINKVEEIGNLIKDFNKDIFYVVDGTQAVAHIPVDVKKIKADFYAFSSHKMYGPDGVGVLYVSKDKQQLIKPVRAGGGSVKDVVVKIGKKYDTIIPDYGEILSTLEGGTYNTSNIIGLSKAIGFLRSIGFEEIRKHELSLTDKLLKELSLIKDIVVYGPKNIEDKIGVVSFAIKDFHIKELADHLNSKNICVRYGSHCAFPLSDNLGNETLRISLGVYNTEEDIDIVIQEIKFFIDKKKGLIKNPEVDRLRNIPFSKHKYVISKVSDILDILGDKEKLEDTEVVVMGGHFLAIPDVKNNTFYPSIKEMLPKDLHNLLDDFGMTTFPIFTLEVATEIVSKLKKEGVKARLFIIANDTTGINELLHSGANGENKKAETYRKELLERFRQEDVLPEQYLKVLKKKKLDLEDVIKYGDDLFFRETTTRANFKDFVSKNKEKLEGVIDYHSDNNKIDISISILKNENIKTCKFDTFNSKTGGKFCIIEVAQILAEMFGVSKKVDYSYISEKIKEPISNNKNKVFLMLSPELCNNAINGGAELYLKLFLQGASDSKFRFINIPFGPNANKNIKDGVEVSEIRNY